MTMHWLDIKKEEKLDILIKASESTGLEPYAIEKDWWMVQTLRLIWQMDVANHLVFKGGSSLSKGWGLIERFSEDIDLALDREFLGFSGSISRTQVGKLRDASYAYISDKFYPLLIQKFEEAGFPGLNIVIANPEIADQDPLIIDIYYPYVTQQSTYVQPRIRVEVGGRSLREPFSNRQFSSMVGEHFKGKDFADDPIEIPCVNPERTFLEKLFLLHEEFQKPQEKIRVDRLSRHLYDIERISNTGFAETAMADKELYHSIVTHRERFTRIGGIDYTSHFPPNLNPIPPKGLIKSWEKDYKEMQERMIYGESLPFNKLLEVIAGISDQINQLKS